MLAFIFDCLDGDRDNWISINAINIEVVSRDISQILMPIIQELEDLREIEARWACQVFLE